MLRNWSSHDTDKLSLSLGNLLRVAVPCGEIMFGSVFKADRLRVNLQLVVNRLKLLERKKTEQAQKARKEVADHLAAGKDERARIRVEHIIREDYLVEAMEILELYCNLLLARFSLIQATKELDSGLAESVSTLIWAAPRLQSEVPELKIAEAPADLVSVGFTEADKQGAPDGGGAGTAAGPGEPVWASPISAPEPLPVRSPVPGFSSLPPGRQNDSFKNDLHPTLVPGPGFNPQTSPKPASRTKIGFDNFMLPDLPDVKPQASLSIDPYDSEEIDFADLDRRLEMLKKTT
ncbi:IST1 homolog isoform X5 [Myotis daubentonii]|uniref:IST1 homolog isoform X5 n=1 Tax=Myotis daubentonii TaxID=98922 RepID=UPI002872D073|nr:IST1 homolog isoform X5 [Myotis daubentonii]